MKICRYNDGAPGLVAGEVVYPIHASLVAAGADAVDALGRHLAGLAHRLRHLARAGLHILEALLGARGVELSAELYLAGVSHGVSRPARICTRAAASISRMSAKRCSHSGPVSPRRSMRANNGV